MARDAAPVASTRIRLMRHSFAYACPGLSSRACRHSVTLLLASGSAPLQVQWRQGTVTGHAVLVAPVVERTLCAADTPLVVLDLEPRHASFRRFSLGAAAQGVQCLPETRVRALVRVARDFHEGRLVGAELDARMQAAIAALAAHWPDPGTLDPRVDWMMRTLDRHPCTTLEQMAQVLAMSPSRASRLFSMHMGIHCRAYALAAKIHAAALQMGNGRRLTEVAADAGFADSAHFAKVWLRCYGAPPSVFLPAHRTAQAPGGTRPAEAMRPAA